MKFYQPHELPAERLGGPLIVAVQPFPKPGSMWLVPDNYETYPVPLRKILSLMFLIQDSARRNLRDIANPRGMERLVRYLRTALTAAGDNDDVTLILPEPGTAIPEAGRNAGFKAIRRPGSDSAQARRDAILEALRENPNAQLLVVYSDAIGHGNGWLERRLFRAGCETILVLNGRGRMFEMSPADLWTMTGRRALVQSRIVELSIAVLLWPVAGALALKDALTGAKGNAK